MLIFDLRSFSRAARYFLTLDNFKPYSPFNFKPPQQKRTFKQQQRKEMVSISKAEVPKLLLISVFRIFIFASYILLIFVNIGYPKSLFCDNTNADVSNAHPTAITPAGYAFSIWGLIFFLQSLFAVWSLFPLRNLKVLLNVAPFIVTSWYFEMLWTFAFNCQVSEMILQAIFIVIAAIFMGIAYVISAWRRPSAGHVIILAKNYFAHKRSKESLKYELGYEEETEETMPILGRCDTSSFPSSHFLVFLFEFIFVYLPSAINFAWLSVAAQLGIIIALNQNDVTVSSNIALISIIIVVILCGIFSVLFRDVVFSLTAIWAITAVAVGNSEDSTIFIGGCVALGLIVIMIVLSLIYETRKIIIHLRVQKN
jgi:hypothetical protein